MKLHTKLVETNERKWKIFPIPRCSSFVLLLFHYYDPLQYVDLCPLMARIHGKIRLMTLLLLLLLPPRVLLPLPAKWYLRKCIVIRIVLQKMKMN